MEYLYLCLIIVGVTVQNVVKKAYNVKTGGKAGFTYSSGLCFTALLFFVISSGFKFDFRVEILPFAFGFAVSYGVATIFSFLAIRCGSLSLTSLLVSYSLIIPTFYGLIFLDETVSPFFYFGIAALLISLFLINVKKQSADKGSENEPKITPRWLLFAALAFIGNGACSTIQTAMQTFVAKELGEGVDLKGEMMMIALFTVSAVFFAAALITERDEMLPSFKKGSPFMAIGGAFNGLVNLLVMVTVKLMNPSVMFPLISAGGIVLTALVSIFFYKERLSRTQYLGFVLGIAAIVLLNI